VKSSTGVLLASVKTTSGIDGTWHANIGSVPGSFNATVCVQGTQRGKTLIDCLNDVNFGEVILCGGQSNMGYGMCGAQSATQTPTQAIDAINPIRFFLQMGTGPGGGSPHNSCRGVTYSTPFQAWFTAKGNNTAGASAICMLTASNIYAHLEGKVPVGAVESCVSGTNVAPWTPGAGGEPAGALWSRFMVPIVPFTFKAALWDQGEADAKRTNSTWYAHEFPTMITRWREQFETQFPFIYVELCSEYGALEPKESSFWAAMRIAVKDLPDVGFVTTTDIQRALHPPDKQDVAERLLLSFRKLALKENDVVTSGPELLNYTLTGEQSMVLTFSNESLVVKAGILVGTEADCEAVKGHDSMVTFSDVHDSKVVSLNYTIVGNQVKVQLPGVTGLIRINSDATTCFLYSSESGLPAPPTVVETNAAYR